MRLPTLFSRLALVIAAGLLLTGGAAVCQTTSAPPPQPASTQPAPPPVQQTSPPPAVSASSPAHAAPFGEITGTVKSGNTPLPGVTVSAANTLTGRKIITSTAVDGTFKIQVPGRGRYVVRADFSAFAPVTQEVLINPENRTAKADLSMILLSRAEKQQEEEKQQQARQLAAAASGRGMQQLSLSGTGMDDSSGASPTDDPTALGAAGLPNAGLAADGSNESVAVSGSMGRSEMPTFDPNDLQDRIAELRDQLAQGGGGTSSFTLNGRSVNLQIMAADVNAGGFAGGGGPMIIMMGGGGGGGRGGRGGRGFAVNRPHGAIFYNYGGSALDARPYSLNGVPEDKAGYAQNRFGVTLGGPLNIPHIYNGGTKTFLFGSYFGSRNSNAFDAFSNVPTLAERNGDFSALPFQIKDPLTGLPFPSNQITSINSAAAGLLSFIPEPNLPGTVRNFHFISSSTSNTDTAFIRFNHTFGAQPAGPFGAFGGRAARRAQQQNGQSRSSQHWNQSINGGFNYNNNRNLVPNPFPDLGGNASAHNYNGNFGYNLSKGLFFNSLRFNYNHAQSVSLNQFTGVTDIEGQLGITGVSTSPADFGLPLLNFSEFSGLRDISPAHRSSQNITLSDSMRLSRGKHSWSWGGDYRRFLVDVSNATNARGSFTFNGAASGFDFADFLLGFAQQTSIQFGSDDYHFRSNSFNLYVLDNWRAGKNFTFNLGLRYEYAGPLTEADGRMVNLDIAPGFTAVAPVLPDQIGPLTNTKYPDALIHADSNNFAPRIGIAWKAASHTVVRSGYAINYNLGQNGSIATQLGFQPPFAVAQTNFGPTVTSLTLQNGFLPVTSNPNHITNSYAIDPNYALAYVQVWNLNIQQQIHSSIVLNIGYIGSKGTHLDIMRAPDQLASGAVRFPGCTATTPAGSTCVAPFLFESSLGSSILHSGTISVRKRMRNGFSLGGNYTYSKSIDDASSIGGGASVVAQNDQDLAAERGLSSFDQRHRFNLNYIYELPFGKNKKWLAGDRLVDRMFNDFSFSGNMTIASGFPFSPQILGSQADLARGVSGALRPNLVPGQPLTVGNPGIQQWFNTAAFCNPAVCAPVGVFGNAGRNIIIGPGTVNFSMSVSKNIQLREMQGLELRITASNVFNHANFNSIDTVLGSPTFGQVRSVAGMRTAQLSARYRF